MFFFGDQDSAVDMYRNWAQTYPSVPKFDWCPYDEMTLKQLRIAYVVSWMACSTAGQDFAPEEVQEVLNQDHVELFEELLKYCPKLRKTYKDGLFRMPMVPSKRYEKIYKDIYEKITSDPAWDLAS